MTQIFPNPAIKLSHNFFLFLLNDTTVNEDKYHVYHQKENKLRVSILSSEHCAQPHIFSLHKPDHVVGACSSQANTQPSTMHAHGSAPAIGGQPTTRCHRLIQYHPSPKVNIIVYVLSCRDPKFPHTSVNNDFYSPINHKRNFIFQRH